jgi:hypothetical protein
VNVQLNADVTAPAGLYDVQLTSAGVTGNGFFAGPGGQTGSKSNVQSIAVSGQSNLTLSVTSAGNPVAFGQCL